MSSWDEWAEDVRREMWSSFRVSFNRITGKILISQPALALMNCLDLNSRERVRVLFQPHPEGSYIIPDRDGLKISREGSGYVIWNRITCRSILDLISGYPESATFYLYPEWGGEDERNRAHLELIESRREVGDE